MIKVSVVVPAYNKELYVERSIRSLLDQNFDDYEVIVVEDCSTDATYDILRGFADRDARIKLYRNERNMGAAYSRNRGLDLAAGRYVIFLDADDYYYPDMLDTLYDIAEREAADVVFPGFRMVPFADDGVSVDEDQEILEFGFPYKSIEPHNENDSFFDQVMINVLRFCRLEFLRKSGIHFQALPSSNDVLFAYATTVMAGRIVWSGKICIDYYTNTTGSLDSSKDTEDYAFEAYAAVWEWLSEHDIDVRIKGWCVEHTLGFVIHDLLCMKPSFDKCRQNLEQMRDSEGFKLPVELAKRELLSPGYACFINDLYNTTDPGRFPGTNPYIYKRDMISDVFSSDKPDGQRVCLWGCGIRGKRLIDYLNENTDYAFDHVVDSSPSLRGTEYGGYTIEDYAKIRDTVDIVVFTTRSVCDEVSEIVSDKKTVVL